ncbi:hypothetical protein D3C71_1463450 [compost metagenome]
MIAFSGKTHLTIGVIIWCFFPHLSFIFVAIGSLFPDSDHRKAIMGRILPLWILGFKHRGLTHHLWFVAIVSWLIDMYVLKGSGWSFFIGCASHIIGDMISSEK